MGLILLVTLITPPKVKLSQSVRSLVPVYEQVGKLPCVSVIRVRVAVTLRKVYQMYFIMDSKAKLKFFRIFLFGLIDSFRTQQQTNWPNYFQLLVHFQPFSYVTCGKKR